MCLCTWSFVDARDRGEGIGTLGWIHLGVRSVAWHEEGVKNSPGVFQWVRGWQGRRSPLDTPDAY